MEWKWKLESLHVILIILFFQNNSKWLMFLFIFFYFESNLERIQVKNLLIRFQVIIFWHGFSHAHINLSKLVDESRHFSIKFLEFHFWLVKISVIISFYFSIFFSKLIVFSHCAWLRSKCANLIFFYFTEKSMDFFLIGMRGIVAIFFFRI